MDFSEIKELGIGTAAIVGLVYVIMRILSSAERIATSRDAIISRLLDIIGDKNER